MSSRLSPVDTALKNLLSHPAARAALLACGALVLALPAQADPTPGAPASGGLTPVTAAPEVPAARSSGPKTAAQAEALDPILGVKLGTSGPRQYVHVLIRRKERDEGKNEFSLNESLQVNGKFTDQIGTGVDWLYHLREAFAFGLGGTWYEYRADSAFTEDELVTKAKQQPYTASALLMNWEAHAGFELSPIYGKFAWFNSGVVQFGLYVGSALGLASTEVELRPADPNTGRGRTFGDTGFKPVGLFDVGYRMFFSEHWALRAEIRDTLFSSDVQTINGCTANDLQAMTSGDTSHIAATCNQNAFLDKQADGNTAHDLLKDPSSDVLNDFAFNLALSFLF